MSATHTALAVAIAVSLGIIKPTLSPIREEPLAKSDILIVDNSEQGSAKIGNGSASDNSSGQSVNEASKSDKMSGSASK
jgi:hypothetical protein